MHFLQQESKQTFPENLKIKKRDSGFYFGQSFSPLHSPETPVNRVFGVSNRVFAFSDQVLEFLHQEFAFLTSFQPENRICM